MRTHSTTATRPSRSLFFPERDYHYHPLTKRELAQMHLDVKAIRRWAEAHGGVELAQVVRKVAEVLKRARGPR